MSAKWDDIVLALMGAAIAATFMFVTGAWHLVLGCLGLYGGVAGPGLFFRSWASFKQSVWGYNDKEGYFTYPFDRKKKRKEAIVGMIAGLAITSLCWLLIIPICLPIFK